VVLPEPRTRKKGSGSRVRKLDALSQFFNWVIAAGVIVNGLVPRIAWFEGPVLQCLINPLQKPICVCELH
jgi:hypothetical protein